MVNRRITGLAAGVIVVAIIVGVLALPGEEKKIKKQFSRLSTHVSKASNEGLLDTALRVRRTEALFAPQCTVNMAEAFFNGEMDSSTLVAQGFQVRMQFTAMKLSFSDFKILFPEKDHATCEVIAKLAGTGPAGNKINESREMVWDLRKIEGSWRFEKVEEVVVLKK